MSVVFRTSDAAVASQHVSAEKWKSIHIEKKMLSLIATTTGSRPGYGFDACAGIDPQLF